MSETLFQVFTQDGQPVKIGSRVVLKVRGLSLWLKDNSLVISSSSPDPLFTGIATFVVYGAGSQGTLLSDTNKTIGLYSLSQKKFLSISDDGSLGFRQCNNNFVADPQRDSIQPWLYVDNIPFLNKSFFSLIYSSAGNNQILTANTITGTLSFQKYSFPQVELSPTYDPKVVSVPETTGRVQAEDSLPTCRTNLLPETPKPANHPWLFVGFMAYYTKFPERVRVLAVQADYKGTKNVIYRITPPEGYACIGDMIIAKPSWSNAVNEAYEGLVTLVFLYIKDSLNTYAVEMSSGNIFTAGNLMKNARCNFNVSSIPILRGSPNALPGYVPIADSFQIGEKPIVWAVRRDLVEAITQDRYSQLTGSTRIGNSYSSGGRWMAGGGPGGCNFDATSTAVLFDKTNPATPRMLLGHSAYVNEQNDTDWKVTLNASKHPMFLLFSEKQQTNCCTPGSTTGLLECGHTDKFVPFGSKCGSVASRTCVADNSSELAGDFCKQNIKYSPSDSALLDADNEVKKFCNTKVYAKDGSYCFPNYTDYPDLCACMMNDPDFLRPLCDYTAKQLRIDKNEKAKTILGLNWRADPSQCTSSCINPLCSTQTVTRRPTDNITIPPRPIFKGSKGLTCPNTNLCIQNVTVTNTGQIGTLNINQQVEGCQALQSICTPDSAVFSSCSVSSPAVNGVQTFSKTIIDEKQQLCGYLGQQIECVKIDLNTKTDLCNGSTRTISYKVLNKDSVLRSDVIEVLSQWFVTSDLKSLSPILDYANGLATITTTCSNCETTLIPQGECFLDGTLWKQRYSPVVSKQAVNGGTCPLSVLQPTTSTCSQTKDCALRFVESTNGCVNGVSSFRYAILSQPSGQGKTCEEVFKAAPRMELPEGDYNLKKSDDGNSLVAEFNCRDCIVDYKIDPLNNKCVFNPTLGKTVRRKIPYFVREASGGGNCSQKDIDTVSNQTVVFEECSTNQDCEFSTKPSLDSCDDSTGVRTLVYPVTKPSLGTGKSCAVSAGVFSPGILNISSRNYNQSTQSVTVKASCQVKQDCVLGSKKEKCNSGVSEVSYPIVTSNTITGLSCLDVALSKGVKNPTVVGNEVRGLGVCARDTKTILYIAGGLIVLVILIVFKVMRR